ncbi:DUF3892 domain-containing protein [Mucilaginibacter daejeonensis]|uniref:DUF3892 domain-containing protein n=1 Tax=Mucilaginibacter daejeonensis TaxID=398049 RepID=UPI00374D9BE3|nr:DUF3892 domain-containing protein [Mucilaginibacter daejeonensis]
MGGLLRGSRWMLSLPKAILCIEQGQYNFYISVNGPVRKIILALRHGNKYLRTEADRDTPDNLLSLPECPVVSDS